jgi:hypothetical protein
MGNEFEKKRRMKMYIPDVIGIWDPDYHRVRKWVASDPVDEIEKVKKEFMKFTGKELKDNLFNRGLRENSDGTFSMFVEKKPLTVNVTVEDHRKNNKLIFTYERELLNNPSETKKDVVEIYYDSETYRVDKIVERDHHYEVIFNRVDETVKKIPIIND